MCDLFLTERAKERIADLRKNYKEEMAFEQSGICQAMSTAIFAMIDASEEERESFFQILCTLRQYDDLITELSKEN